MIDWETFKTQLQTNPSKVLKSVLLLAGCFFLIWLLIVSQNDLESPPYTPSSSRLDSLNLAAPARDSLANKLTQNRGRNMQPAMPSSPRFSSLLAILLVFLILIGGVWFWLRSRKSSRKAKPGAIFTTIATQKLPSGQQLIVALLNGEYWVMAAGGPQGTTLLHRYTAEEWEGIDEPQENSRWQETFKNALRGSSSQPKPNNSDSI